MHLNDDQISGCIYDQLDEKLSFRITSHLTKIKPTHHPYNNYTKQWTEGVFIIVPKSLTSCNGILS